MANLFTMGQGTYANYAALPSKSQYEVYFTTDTHQIFVGAAEYTKSTKTLSAVPTISTEGDTGRLYSVAVTGGNELYLCTGLVSGEYQWVRVANINDVEGTVTSIEAGEGLETADGQAITSTGTIKHSVPTGAATVTDDLSDQTPAFGSTFAIKGLSTDKFGHVTGVADHAVTIPVETKVTTASGSTAASTLEEGSSFTVITGVSATGNDHQVTYDTTTFTLPSDVEVTYTISSVEEGVITLTGSDASSSTALINGWNDLAKKSELASLFRYKGSVATVANLPTDANVKVGDVYQVATGPQGSSCEYVAVTDGPNATWEELGTTIDLSAYATTAYVDSKLTWHEF